MAKAILEFDLNDPDDNLAHLRAIKSLDMALAIWEFAINTQKSLQHKLEFKDLSQYEVLDMVFERFYDILNKRGIDIEELLN